MGIIKCTTKYRPQEVAKATGSPEKTPLGQGKVRILKKNENFPQPQQDVTTMGQSLKTQLREIVAGMRLAQKI